MKLIKSLVVVSLVSLSTNAQPPDTLWTHTYGGNDTDKGLCVQQTTDSGYIISGYTQSYGVGVWDIYLIKTDSDGDTVWTKTYGDSLEKGYYVRQTSDGGYIVAGYKPCESTGIDLWIIKTDVNGDSVWTRTFGGNLLDVGQSVQQTSDGGYIISGYTESYSAGLYDIYLIKTDANGDSVWTKTFGGSNAEVGASVQQTSDGGYIISGTTQPYGAYSDAILIKTDANGDSVWGQIFGGYDYDYSGCVQQTSDGGYILTGQTYSYGAGLGDVYLIKTDANGDSVWTKTFGGYDNDCGNSVQQTSDGGYIIGGSTSSFSAGYSDVWLIKTDSGGDSVWTQTFGGYGDDRGRFAEQTSDGGYIMVGETESTGSGNFEVWLIRLESDGLPVGDFGFYRPGEFVLYSAFPNPFNPTTTLSFTLPNTSRVNLSIYNTSGRLVETVVDSWFSFGTHEVTFDASGLTSGIYVAKLVAGSYAGTQKLLLIK